jgi:hypothetical protein
MKPIQEFISDIDDVYGVYLDGKQGFDLLETKLKQLYRGKSATQLRKESFIYGVGNPNNPNSYPLHKVPKLEHQERNSKSGKNRYVLANQALVQIYQYWEDRYREEIAKELGLEKTEFKVDIFGDVRILRNAIIHNHAIATSDVERCKILTWFDHKQAIRVSPKKFEELIRQVKNGLKEIESRDDT